MKATTWLCPVLTLLCATRLVCTAQRGYPLDYADSNMLQDDYLLEKRNKPSLSIVNPLDVLRQRLLLEIARRQMKENTRQVELNRAILKNVGKRMPTSTEMARRYQLLQHRLQQQPSEMNYAPAVSILDFLQRPVFDELENEKKSLDISTKHQLNGNEIGNETNRDGTSILRDTRSSSSSSSNASDMNNAAVAGHDSEDGLDDDDIDNGGYQLRYLYRMHKNHLTRK